MKKYFIVASIVACFVIVMVSCKKENTDTASTPPSTVSELSAGIETIFDESASAFGDDFPVITPALEDIHDNGEVIFNEIFTPPPGYYYAYYTGLGPIFNNNSCNACHGGVGEGNPPLGGGSVETSMLFRISSGNNVTTGPIGVTGFGGQLQNNAVAGVMPEGTVNIQYTDVTGHFGDGTTYSLQVPTYSVTASYIPFPAGSLLSPRVAPRLVGLGFLEIIPESAILANSGTYPVGDTTHINGQPNYVWDFTTSSTQLGRFGWKAEAPTLKQQLAGAYVQDMGVTNSVFPQESSYGQSQYATYTGDPSPELPDSELYANLEYVQTLAVPAERNGTNPQVIRGAQIFNSSQAQCASCHIPTMTTPSVVNYPDTPPAYANAGSLLTNIVIHPYTDMLLHDMGAGLADNRPAFAATGRQWRTPPLWGIGYLPIVDPSGQYLHDGRARNIMEAIMWHGGEAYNAREYVRNLSASDRAALVAFVQSL
ncbi:MAG TPA: di-heme oxidoredictase family protein [Bacteroidia bacterium]|jgi:CxxC motif-containing protein (DUF1111 family)|nr:di-heme oxidoredictase family protein [Bacteroidia bacterium]